MIFNRSDNIRDIIIINPTIHNDERGYFFESYKDFSFKEFGLEVIFVQDNQVKSKKGALRGLHYQLIKPQGKLVWVSQGSVLDVAVDLRKNSPTFKQYFSIILDDIHHRRVFIPPGFAHGYYVLSSEAIFQYKCTNYYYPEDEYGIAWNDPEIGIKWPDGKKIISNKDLCFSPLAELDQDKLPTMLA